MVVVALSDGPDLVSGLRAAKSNSAVFFESSGISILDFPLTKLELIVSTSFERSHPDSGTYLDAISGMIMSPKSLS